MMAQTESEVNSAPRARLRHRVFTAMSWRMETRANRSTIDDAQQQRERFGQLLYWTGAHRGLPNLTDRAAILCFHGLGAGRLDPEVEDSILPVSGFRQLLRVLRQSFRVLPLAELVQTLAEHRPLPSRSVVITFDDGYASNIELAAPELEAMKMPWSAFLPARKIETGEWLWTDDVRILVHRGARRELSFRLGRELLRFDLSTQAARTDAVNAIHQRCRYVPENVREPALRDIYEQYSVDELQSLRQRFSSFRLMNWEQARQLKVAGVDVGNHSLNHVALAVQTPERIHSEVLDAKQILKKQLGSISPHFSYPYGNRSAYSEQTSAVLREAGYQCALTLVHEMVPASLEDLMSLPRLIVSARIGRLLTLLWQRFNG